MVNQYNILIMLNDSYYKFGCIFLNSLYANVDLSKINYIFVNNIGLSESNKIILQSKYDKIRFIETNVSISTNAVHSKEWISALTMKTKTLYSLLQTIDNLPIILMDTDMFVLRDFTELLDDTYDIQVCKRETPSIRNDLPIKQMKYIACFVAFYRYSEVIDQFMCDWMKEINRMQSAKLTPAYETPSMCAMIELYKSRIRFGDILQQHVASESNNASSRVLHFRSWGNESFEKRINRIIPLEQIKHFMV